MTETTIPFQGQTAVLDRPVAGVEDPIGPSGGNRNKLLALGAVAGLLVLAVLAYFLVFAGGDDPAPSAPVSSGSEAAPEAGTDQPAAAKVRSPRLTNKNFGRDPFKALITEPEAGAVTDPVATSGAVSGATTTTTTTSDTSTGTGTTTGTSSPTESTPHRFKVVDVAPDNSRISVKVDGKFYRNLKAGEVFATFFKVRFIGGAVNDFQFGEESFKVVGTKAVSIG